MQKTLSLKLIALAAALVFAFGFATQAFASTDYYEIEIGYEVKDTKTVVEVDYVLEEGDSEVSKAFTFFTTNLDDVWKDVAVELDLSVDDIEDILAGEYGDEEEGSRDDAEEAIEDAELALEDAFYEVEDEDDADKKAELQGHYDDAEEKLDDAKDAFGLGDYAEAEELAEEAEDILEDYILGDDDDEDEEEEDDKEDAEDAIEDAKERIAKAAAYIEGLQDDGKDTENLEGYLEKAENKLELAKELFDNGDYEEAEEMAEAAEDKAKVVLDAYGGDDDDDRKHDWKCDDDFPGIGWGVQKKCSDDDWDRDRDRDRFKDFGKTTDKAELQNQLRLLLMLLIELLQEQM